MNKFIGVAVVWLFCTTGIFSYPASKNAFSDLNEYSSDDELALIKNSFSGPIEDITYLKDGDDYEGNISLTSNSDETDNEGELGEEALYTTETILPVSFNVTFEVDLSDIIGSTAFDSSKNYLSIAGGFNDWSTVKDTLHDINRDGVYSITLVLEEGEYLYKYYVHSIDNENGGWEKNSERVLNVNGNITRNDGNVLVDYDDLSDITFGSIELVFEVDLSDQILNGNFDPEDENHKISVAGEFNGWSTLVDFLEPKEEANNIYRGLVSVEDAVIPNTFPYKFVLNNGDLVWETGENREIHVTKSDSVDGKFQRLNYLYKVPVFDKIGEADSIAYCDSASKPCLEDTFVFFLNGVNVQIPSIEGEVVPDPKDVTSDNRVFKINYASWSEFGFRWPSIGDRDTVGFDASSWTGDSYGDTDTLFFRLLSDPANAGQLDFIGLIDTQSEEDPVAGVDDLPFRLRWRIPDWAHDGEWHDFAIPFPPRTAAFLDSAKAGKSHTGEDLGVEVDSLFMNWEYAGAWASGSVSGHWNQNDPYWAEFDWESVKYIGRHADHANGGEPIYLDYFSVGVRPEELMDVITGPVSSINIETLNGVNSITWNELEDAFAYNLYFSESPITGSINNDEIIFLGRFKKGEQLLAEHRIIAPHADFGKNFTSYYAVTALSELGSESENVTTSITSDLDIEESFAVELDNASINDIYDSISNSGNDQITLSGVEIRNMFPDGYKPFTIDENRKVIENGTGGDDDEDLSGKFWVGFGSTNNELIVYAEIKDDSLVFLSSPESPNSSWAYDGWQMGIGNYTPSSFIKSSTHDPFQRGAEPDYQLRASNLLGGNPFIYEAYTSELVSNSQTIFEETAYGYRLLTLINTVNLTDNVITQNDALFDFPDSSEVTLYPFNIAIDDNDDVNGTRDTQVSWSGLAGDDTWWRNPTKWQTVAFVGKNRVQSLNHYTSSILRLDSKEGFLSDTLNFGIELSKPGDEPIESFQFDIEFDSSKVSLEFIEQTGFLSEEFTVVTNESIPGVLRVSAAGALGIETEGILYGIQIIPKNAGESGISVSEIFINEEKHELLNATLKFYERLCGDVTNDRSVSALDATFILRNTVFLEPQFPLVELDSIAADVTGNGDITAFDAAKVLQHDIGLIETLSCGGNLGKSPQKVSKASWGIAYEDESTLEVLIDYSTSEIEENSMELQLNLPRGVSFRNIEGLQKGWTETSNIKEKKVYISAFGIVPPENKTLTLVFSKEKRGLISEIEGELMFNESIPVSLPKIIHTEIPQEFDLGYNYPNPFNPETNIVYALPERVKVEVSIYNILGQKVALLVNNVQEPGNYQVKWDASNMSSGVYIYTISAGEFYSSKKMMLIK